MINTLKIILKIIISICIYNFNKKKGAFYKS